MKDLIRVLENEHVAIMDMLNAVRRKGVHTVEGRNELTEASELLCDHIKKEDEFLYPALHKFSNSDADLSELLSGFEKDIKNLSSFCKKFFKKYSISGGGIEFLSDFDKLYSLLSKRIHNEELYLYTKYKEKEQMK
ncbi:MAG: hemerythrin domain-containing protein [Acidobacteriota bacterium]